jgi:hypothetical protein
LSWPVFSFDLGLDANFLLFDFSPVDAAICSSPLVAESFFPFAGCFPIAVDA